MNEYPNSAPPIDASVLTGTTSTPWATPSLRKINAEIHDNSTQMRILGEIMFSLGDLIMMLIGKVNEQNEKIDKSIVAINELTETLKETLG